METIQENINTLLNDDATGILTKATDRIFDTLIDSSANVDQLVRAGVIEATASIVRREGHNLYIYHRCFSILATLVIANRNYATSIMQQGAIDGGIRVIQEHASHRMLMSTVLSFYYIMSSNIHGEDLKRCGIVESTLQCLDSNQDSPEVFFFGCDTLFVAFTRGALREELVGSVERAVWKGVRTHWWDDEAQRVGRQFLYRLIGTNQAMLLIGNYEYHHQCSMSECSPAA